MGIYSRFRPNDRSGIYGVRLSFLPLRRTFWPWCRIRCVSCFCHYGVKSQANPDHWRRTKQLSSNEEVSRELLSNRDILIPFAPSSRIRTSLTLLLHTPVILFAFMDFAANSPHGYSPLLYCRVLPKSRAHSCVVQDVYTI